MSRLAIGELSSEVAPVETEGATGARPAATQPWEQLERARRLEHARHAAAELACMYARTRAEGFDA